MGGCGEDPVAIPVEFTVKENRHPTLLSTLQAHAQNCPAQESGCLRFEVFLPILGGRDVTTPYIYIPNH
jgi:quinol monooxygenase YgiN